ncbi:hypothetical protein PV326_000919 [Microctonus aethiopoides]|nr:hypothetical protein PV326_000919 [Microctonus aethiopoides]
MEKEPVEWKEINKLFGPLVEADLRESNVVVEKTLTGGLIVPKKYGFILDECRHLYKKRGTKKITVKNNKSDEYEKQMMKCKPENYDLDDEDNFDLRNLDFSFNNVKEQSAVSSQSSETSHKSTTSGNATTIGKKDQIKKLLNIPYYVKFCNYKNFNNSHLFSSNLTTADKFRKFMGPGFINYELCIPFIEPIFDNFLRKHKRFPYKHFFKNLPQDKSLINGQISRQQLQSYFRRIFATVVPVKLFGNMKNVKKIQRMINNYFKTAFGEYFSAQAVTNNLNINAIEWLCAIEDGNMKISIMSQLVESFFEEYIMAVMGTYIYTEKMTSSNEKVFCRLTHWIYHSNKYIRQKKTDGVYKEITENDLNNEIPNDIPNAKLSLHLKKNGMRPILLTHPTPAQKREAKILNKLLHQLYLKKFELVTLQQLEKLWRNIHTCCAGKSDKPLYFISCDIHDAFGSINQQKLLDIVLGMMDELEDKLILQNFAIFNPRYSKTEYMYREYFDSPSLPLVLPAKTLSCRDNNTCSIVIEKEWLKNRMKSYILQRKIVIHNKLYYQTKGIGQGIPLTSLLCEIYYGNMVLEKFGCFINSGQLLRYVDDFLYFTQDKSSAERFLEQVHSGIESYDCTFNPRKTSTNLPPYCMNEFVYLGYRFNIKTFDVTPEVSKIPVRYLTNLSRPEIAKSLATFTKRLKNFGGVKINKLVLDPSINSKASIEKTIYKITLLSARRCLTYLLSIFDSKEMSGSRIFDVIKKHSVNSLCIKLLRFCFARTETGFQIYEEQDLAYISTSFP